MTRRTALLLACAPALKAAQAFDPFAAPSTLRTVEPAHELKLTGTRNGNFYQARLSNPGQTAVHVKEISLFQIPHSFPDESALYGESFQMLSQTAGTLGNPLDLGYDEQTHYRIPQPGDAHVVTGMLTLTPPGEASLLLAFTSCRRFHGRFYLRPQSIEVVLDAEGLAIAPGETWDLEEFAFLSGGTRPALLAQLADRINQNHPPLKPASPPAGWCSWYCFGPSVTAKNVIDNLSAIAREVPQLKYVQIDDGYQRAMGDWLETGDAFGGDLRGVLQAIRKQGLEPALWVAPFIAERGSHLFEQHPGWFMKGADGQPLPADRVTFQGWRRGPWYALDGSHPEVQQHLETLFRTLRQEWGVTYFKLDANFWGAMHGGKLYDAKATRIEAYRRGMQAIRKGAGDAFLLGCNHPVWPSLGLLHGSRSSEDIARQWTRIQKVALQNLNRNWQNGRLWWNDPDAILLSGSLPDIEYRFHVSAALASGGMILSGDDLSALSPAREETLKKMLPPSGIAAEFENESLKVGVIHRSDHDLLCVFNWESRPISIAVKLPRPSTVRDLWTGQDYGRRQYSMGLELKPHEATVLVVKRAN